MRVFYSLLTAAFLGLAGGYFGRRRSARPQLCAQHAHKPGNGIRRLASTARWQSHYQRRLPAAERQASPGVARLNADGSPDLAFRAQAGSGPNSSITALALQADGKILLGARIRPDRLQWHARAKHHPPQCRWQPWTPRSARVARVAGGEIRSIAVQADGNILVGGACQSTFNGQPTKGLSAAATYRASPIRVHYRNRVRQQEGRLTGKFGGLSRSPTAP